MDGDFDLEDKSVSVDERPRIDPDIFNQLFTRPTTGKIVDGGGSGCGKVGEAPGKVGEAPGKVGEAPGKVGEAPGKVGEAPGKVGEAPGKVGEAPGKIPGDAPGKIPGDAPGKIPGDAPGKVGEAPGKIPGDAPGKIPGDAPGKIPGDAPGKINGDAPGKINDGGGHLLEQLDRIEMIREAGDAVRSGKIENLQNSIKNAFEKSNGDSAKFQKFGQSFAEQSAKDGITVKAGKDSMSVHADGSPYGVEFKVDGNLDFKTGQVKGDVKAQTYDWNTKKDVNVKAADVIKDLSNRRRR